LEKLPWTEHQFYTPAIEVTIQNKIVVAAADVTPRGVVGFVPQLNTDVVEILFLPMTNEEADKKINKKDLFQGYLFLFQRDSFTKVEMPYHFIGDFSEIMMKYEVSRCIYRMNKTVSAPYTHGIIIDHVFDSMVPPQKIQLNGNVASINAHLSPIIYAVFENYADHYVGKSV